VLQTEIKLRNGGQDRLRSRGLALSQGGLNPFVKDLDLCKEVSKGSCIKSNRKESLDVAHKLRFRGRLKEGLELLKE
jgi:hypothetical protein